MNKNGFIYLETIIAIVILTTSLLFIYTTFNKLMQSEKTRVYYDDVSYVYRAENIKEAFNDVNFKGILSELNYSTLPFLVVGIDSTTLFTGYEDRKPFISNLLSDYDVSQIIVIKESKLNKLKQCNEACSLDNTCQSQELCSTYFNSLSSSFVNYIKSIYVDIPCNYVMLVEYRTCTSYCHNYYAWIGL